MKKFIKELFEAGKKVHFFQVTEQTGAVRHGMFREFRVKLHFGIEGKNGEEPS